MAEMKVFVINLDEQEKDTGCAWFTLPCNIEALKQSIGLCIKGIACRNIAHATYSYYRLSGSAGNHELAVLIRHAAIYQ